MLKCRKVIWLCTIYVALAGCSNDDSLAIRPDPYWSSGSTVGHIVLGLEEDIKDYSALDLVGGFDFRYRLLDNLIRQCSVEISPILKDSNLTEDVRAVKVLRKIDEVLARNNFITCIPTRTLGEGMNARKFNEFSCIKHRMGRQLAEYQQYSETYFYSMDCDIGSILYLSVSESLGLPVSMVSVPKHSFVRWELKRSDGYINWDVNLGTVETDDFYRWHYSPSGTLPLSAEDERNGHYLISLTREEVIGKYYGLIGYILGKAGEYSQAVKYLTADIKRRPYAVVSMNYLADIYLRQPKFRSPENSRTALSLLDRVDGLNAWQVSYIENYACAYAANGEFERAIEIQKSIHQSSYRIEAFKNGKTCWD